MPNKHEPWQLQQMQSLPLHAKVAMTRQRIREWVDYWNARGEDVHVSFSGGKDSTVLLHIAREMYPDMPAIFCDTGLEYPEIRKFAMSHESVTVLRPKMRFPEVIRTYGYPLISKEVAEAIHYARRIGGGGQRQSGSPSNLHMGRSAIEPAAPEKRSTWHQESSGGGTPEWTEPQEGSELNSVVRKSKLITTSHAALRRTVLKGEISPKPG